MNIVCYPLTCAILPSVVLQIFKNVLFQGNRESAAINNSLLDNLLQISEHGNGVDEDNNPEADS